MTNFHSLALLLIKKVSFAYVCRHPEHEGKDANDAGRPLNDVHPPMDDQSISIQTNTVMKAETGFTYLQPAYPPVPSIWRMPYANNPPIDPDNATQDKK
jgi:hypothetical protein